MSICAVIPAAGRGTRLGLSGPKVLIQVAERVSVWQVLYERLRPSVRHVHVVVAPPALSAFAAEAGDDIATGAVTVSTQEWPRGMGDAIFGAAAEWQRYQAILVVWGDQANLSAATVARVVAAHQHACASGTAALTLPLVSLPDPYVEYEVEHGRLLRVRMSREGDECRPGGRSDVGIFCLSTNGLVEAWARYLAEAEPGALTGEVNFLPFLPFLSQRLGWPVATVDVTDPVEARGINTPEDLAFARQRYQQWTT